MLKVIIKFFFSYFKKLSKLRTLTSSFCRHNLYKTRKAETAVLNTKTLSKKANLNGSQKKNQTGAQVQPTPIVSHTQEFSLNGESN